MILRITPFIQMLLSGRIIRAPTGISHAVAITWAGLKPRRNIAPVITGIPNTMAI